YIIINNAEISDKELYTLVQEEKNNKILLEKKEDFFLVTINQEDSKLDFQPCLPVVRDMPMKEIVEKIKSHPHMIMKNEQGSVVSYIDAYELANYILNNHNHLHAYIETILQTINESCTVIDQNENVMFWTKGAEDIFSVSPDEIIGKPITDF